MAVPNTTTFSLTDVVAELGGGETSLQDCFNNSTTDNFDPNYNNNTYASPNSLLRFRNYTTQVPLAYFNGTTSQGISSNEIYIRGDSSTLYLTVMLSVILNDLTDRVILELGNILTISYGTEHNNFIVKWYDERMSASSHLGYRSFGADGLITAGKQYEIATTYSMGNAISFALSGFNTMSWGGSANDALATGSADLKLGYSTVSPMLTKYKGHMTNVKVLNGSSRLSTIDDPSVLSTYYTPIDIVKTIP